MQKKVFSILTIFLFVFSANSAFAYDASYVLGQALFTTSTTGTTATTLSLPKDVEYDPDDGLLYVLDYTNNRVLVYDVATITNGEAAVKVIGQDDFISGASNTALDRLSGPVGLALDAEGDRLFVNQENDRVSIFDVSTIDNGEVGVNFLGAWGGGGPVDAGPTVGQNGFTHGGFGGSAGMAYHDAGANEYLYVSDIGNNRVLVFDVTAIVDGENAVNVLGQIGYGGGNTGSGVPPSGMVSPSHISYINALNYLAVSQAATCIEIFDVAAITDGEAAVKVIGEDELTCDAAAGVPVTGRNSFAIAIPYGSAVDNEKNIFYAADKFHGVLTFDISTITNGEDAVSIIGQTSFAFIDTQTGTTQSLMMTPSDVTVDEENNRIFVVDDDSNRVLVFEFMNITEATALTAGTAGTAYSKTIATEKDQGTIELALVSGVLPPGITLGADGLISGTPTTAGDYSFTLRATDVVIDDVQEFSDSKAFTLSIAASASGGGGGSSGSKVRGCMNALATNYNSCAVIDNGTCLYANVPQAPSFPMTPTPTNPCPVFVSYAKMWSKDNDRNEVMKIQKFLNEKMDENLKVDGTFGLGTHLAVKRFQEKYFNEIIVPWNNVNGLDHSTGWWYQTTTAQANKLSGC